MNIKLTPRLQQIANLVPQDACLADIGTDHGYLPLALLQMGRISKAVASDLREGPLDSARRNAAAYGLQDKISLRLGAGLEQISPAECDTITIAGMGGETIAQILEAAPWTKAGNHTLLMQPMTMIPDLRQYLYANGYQILRETPCIEGKRQYTIIQAIGGGIPTHKPLTDCFFSQALLQDAGAKTYLQYLLRREEKTLAGMRSGQQVGAESLQEQETVVQKLRKAVEELA